MLEPEISIPYPRVWEMEYRAGQVVSRWLEDFPDLFEMYGPLLSTRTGILDLFAQYALMYLLRRNHGIHSLTWFSLAQTSQRIKNLARREAHHKTMRSLMGDESFQRLQLALNNAGLTNFKGEPDLFCWNPDSHAWFFAEAKHRDRFTLSEQKWFRVCRETLGQSVDLRIYRLKAAD